MLEQQQSQADAAMPVPPSPDRFRSLCAELDEYEHLPELIPGATSSATPVDSQSQQETIDASILAGLTMP